VARNLLQIVHAACDEIGIPRPTSVVGSSDAAAQQLLALANRDGTELAMREGSAGGWPQLRKEYPISVLAGTDNYAFPTDLGYFINTTPWDQTQKWPLAGPVSPQVWQTLKSSATGSLGIRTRFRLMIDRIYFDPEPTANADVVFEYYRSTWVYNADTDTYRERWGSDGDISLLPDDCHVLGLIWRYLRAQRLDYQEEFNAYDEYVTTKLGRATMAPVLSLVGGSSEVRLIDECNIPDTGYGV
jgi:hypothetical protein